MWETVWSLPPRVEGEAYEALMEALMETQSTFSLVRREQLRFDDSANQLLDALKSSRLAERRSSRWPGTRLIGRQFARVTRFRCDPEQLPIVNAVGSLRGWVAPAYPEDPWFENEQGRVSFVSVTREGVSWLLDPDLAEELGGELELTERQLKPHELRELVARS